MAEVVTRTCGKCGFERLLTDFYKDRRHRRKDGRTSACRFCEKERRDPAKNSEWSKVYRRTPRGRFSSMHGSSTARGIENSITFEQYETLIMLPCFYCGGRLPEAGTGLDRIDSKQGYAIANVVPCCTECNKIKGESLTVEEMKAVAALLKKMRE